MNKNIYYFNDNGVIKEVFVYKNDYSVVHLIISQNGDQQEIKIPFSEFSSFINDCTQVITTILIDSKQHFDGNLKEALSSVMESVENKEE